MNKQHILIFTKYPEAGKAKTRLAKGVGVKQAAVIAEKLLTSTLVEVADLLKSDDRFEATVCVSPAPEDAIWQQYRKTLVGKFANTNNLNWLAQSEGDLGQRLIAAGQHIKSNDSNTALIYIGTDCPALTQQKLTQVADILSNKDSVLIPAADGGYVLLGINQFDDSLFTNMAWSTEVVAQTTLERVNNLGWSVDVLEKQVDIDHAEDLDSYDVNALLSVCDD